MIPARKKYEQNKPKKKKQNCGIIFYEKKPKNFEWLSESFKI